MKIVLESLHLENFKGMRDYNITFNKDVSDVFGKNASGKTSIYDSFCWLLFGKDGNGREDFGIKTLDADGKAIPKIDHKVTAVFKVGNSKYTLARNYYEVYQHKRNAMEETLKGHTTDYYINEIQVTASEYKNQVEQWFGSYDNARLLTSCSHFVESLEWKERRKILLDIVQITDKEMQNKYKNNESVTAVGAMFDYYPNITNSFELYDAFLTKNRKEYLPKAKELKAQIEAITRFLGEPPKYTVDELTERINGLQNIGFGVDLQEEYDNACADLTKAREAYAELKVQLDNSKKNEVVQSKIENNNKAIEMAKKDIEMYESRIKTLEHEDTLHVKCSKCGTENEIKVNSHNKDELETVNKSLAYRKSLIKEYIEANEQLKEQLEEVDKEKIAKIKEATDSAMALYLTAQKRVQQAADAIQIAKQGGNDALRTIQLELASTMKYEQDAKKLDELKKEFDLVSRQCIVMETNLECIDEYNKLYIKLIEDKISKMLNGYARVQMTRTLTNGKIEECCEIVKDGVPYKYLNTASKINIGLGMLAILQAFYNRKAPVFVDNAEAVEDSNMVTIDTQLIRLYVSSLYNEPTLVQDND